mmetsp:Transcript_4627/g.6502  ORF Transcript_4627/g.6502 Transcript_4627/m.6502 type:complete len:131 (+) Transcript_4627:285-677(+)
MGFSSEGTGSGTSFFFELPLYSSATSGVEATHFNQLKPPSNAITDFRCLISHRLKPHIPEKSLLCHHMTSESSCAGSTLVGTDILVPNDVIYFKADETNEESAPADSLTSRGYPTELKPCKSSSFLGGEF